MANLETLEITINANAQSASKGLDSLINSLMRLSVRVQKTTTSLVLLNTELKTLKGFASLKLPGFGNTGDANKAIKNIKATTKALKEQSLVYNPETNNNRKAVNAAAPGAKSEEQWRKEYEARGAEIRAKREAMQLQNAIRRNPIYRYLNDTKGASSHVQEYINQSMGIGAQVKSAEESASVFMQHINDIKESVPFIERAKKAYTSFKDKVSNFKNSISGLLPKFQLLNRVMRVASTMLIRMGIRALFNGVKEGLTNFYQYSKANGGAFAQTMDTLASTWKQLKNQMGAALAPAISAALPVINALADGAIRAFNALSQLFSLLAGKSSWSRATQQATEFSKAVTGAGGGGGGLKEQLAAFDELNVIASESGGGGGAAAQTADDFVDMFEEMTEFDSKIKDVVSWLEDHLPVVNGLIAGLAAHLLGLPLSITIGIGLAITGISMGAEAGLDMGENGLTAENLFELIKGEILGSIGGALVGAKVASLVGASATAGAMFGIIVGFSITLAATAIGIEEGAKERLFGDLSADYEDIYNYLQSYYTYDTSAYINLIGTQISGLDDMKKSVQESINELKVTIPIAKNANFSQKDVEALALKVKTLVGKTKDYIRGMKEYSLTIDIQFNGQVTEETLKATQGWDVLSGIIENLGTEIGGILSDNIVDEFEKKTLNELTESLIFISSAITTGQKREQYSTASFDIREAFLNGDMNSESFANYIQALMNLNSDTMKAAKDAVARDAENYASEIAGLEAAKQRGYTEWNGIDIDEALESARAKYAQYEDPKLRQGLIDELFGNWTIGFSEGQGGDLEKAYRSIFSKDANLVTTYMKEYLSTYKEDIKNNGNLENVLTGAISYMTGQDKKILLDAKEMFGFTGWDLLTDELRTNLVTILHQNIGMSWDDAIKAVKETYDLDISDILTAINWSGMETGQKQYFAKTIKGIFGDKDTELFIKKRGGALGKEFGEALEAALKKEREEAITTELREKYPSEFAYLSTVVEDWDIVAPMIDTYGLDKSIDIIANTVRQGGANAKTILDNWNLIAPYIDDTNPVQSLIDINKYVNREGIEINTVLKNWNLIAPKVSGIDTETSLKAIKQIAKDTGLDIKTIISKWDLISPNIDKKNVDESVKNISKIINDNRTNWEKILGKNIQTGNAETPAKFGEAAGITISNVYTQLKKKLDGPLKTADASTPSKFGDAAKLSVESIYKTYKDTIGGKLTTADTSTPSKFGEGIKVNIETAYKNYKKIISGELKTADTSTPNGFGDSAGKTINDKRSGWDKTMGGAFTTGNVNLPNQFGVGANTGVADTLTILKQTANQNLTTGDLQIPNNFGEAFIGNVEGLKQAAKNILEGIKPKIEVSAQIDVDMNAKAELVVHNAQIGGINTDIKFVNNRVSYDNIGKASGAYGIDRGEVFIAQEAGAELVGTINGRTSVANQQQIVEGISQGVAQSNEEQNTLLREQNSLLRRILEKDSSVRIGASAAFGRVAKQSLDLYGSMVGG